MEDEQRLVGRVLRHWTEMVHQGDFQRLDEIDPWMLGDDWENCLMIFVKEPVELSHFVSVGKISRWHFAPAPAWPAFSCHVCRVCYPSAAA
jgi:hypothetical protein